MQSTRSMIASSDLVSLVRKRLASPGRRRWPREGLDVARAWRGRGNVAWKGKRCVEGEALRGRGRVAWKGKCCVEGKALRGRENVAWKGECCVEGKALRGRESVARKGKRCAEGEASRCLGDAGPSHFVRLAPYATTPPARVSRTPQSRHIICLTWLVLRVQACPGPGRLVHVRSALSLAHVAEWKHPVSGEPGPHAAAPVWKQTQSTTGPCGLVTPLSWRRDLHDCVRARRCLAAFVALEIQVVFALGKGDRRHGAFHWTVLY